MFTKIIEICHGIVAGLWLIVSVGTIRWLISSFACEIEILKVYRHAMELSIVVHRVSQTCAIVCTSMYFWQKYQNINNLCSYINERFSANYIYNSEKNFKKSSFLF